MATSARKPCGSRLQKQRQAGGTIYVRMTCPECRSIVVGKGINGMHLEECERKQRKNNDMKLTQAKMGININSSKDSLASDLTLNQDESSDSFDEAEEKQEWSVDFDTKQEPLAPCLGLMGHEEVTKNSKVEVKKKVIKSTDGATSKGKQMFVAQATIKCFADDRKSAEEELARRIASICNTPLDPDSVNRKCATNVEPTKKAVMLEAGSSSKTAEERAREELAKRTQYYWSKDYLTYLEKEKEAKLAKREKKQRAWDEFFADLACHCECQKRINKKCTCARK